MGCVGLSIVAGPTTVGALIGWPGSQAGGFQALPSAETAGLVVGRAMS